MFNENPDFFPTPRDISRKMIARISKDAKYFLEPSAGKGDLADVIRMPTNAAEFMAEHPSADPRDHYSDRDFRRSDRHIDVIECYPPLVSVLRGKNYEVVGFDWLTYDGVSYYDAIVMNPPFSSGAAHLLKAWNFLHAGEIVCLLNEETLKNAYTEERQRLLKIIEEFGDVEWLGDCFATAERKTGVNVALVYLKKVAVDDTQDLWTKTPTAEKHFATDFDGDVRLLAIRDNLGNMERAYNAATEEWFEGIEHIRKAAVLMARNKVTSTGGGRDDDFEKILKLALTDVRACRAEFARSLRRRSWTSVFEQMEFHRWLDSKQQDTFMRDVQRDSTVPFTADNIRGTLDNVFRSRTKLFDESVARVFDDLCRNAVENGSGPVAPERLYHRSAEGWKTNDNYKVNKKLIFPYGVEYREHSGFSLGWGEGRTIYSDLDRILCVLDGKAFDKCYTIGQAIEGRCRSLRKQVLPGGAVFESEYFEGRFFKKGTVHLVWKRLDLWERFNLAAAAGKKWIGEDTQQYRPKKRKDGSDADDYRCRKAHDFVDGSCTVCHEPEIDEVEAVECAWCRTIFEHTGHQHCPMHEDVPVALPDIAQYALASGD